MIRYNFSAGPSLLPGVVLEKASRDAIDWDGTHHSILEIGHRTKNIEDLFLRTEASFRELLRIPSSYRLLFLPGGASFQFALVPLNLARGSGKIDFFETGFWSKKALQEARKVSEVNIVASSSLSNYTSIPQPSEWRFSQHAAYCHYTSNETIGGVEFAEIPETESETPLVADMSSNMLSTPFDVTKFGLIYAAAQKNLGVAGLSVVIIREDLLERVPRDLPEILSYKLHAEHASLYNTPPIFAIYVLGLVLDWTRTQGGLEAMAKSRIMKSDKLYNAIDSSGFYSNPVDRKYRSKMNVPFKLPTEALEKLFLKEASGEGLLNLEGHRSIGGMRASLYNAMPEDGVVALTAFMKEFQKKYG